MSGSVALLTRTPDPGRVKTRLIPALGAEGAARLHAALTLECTRRALASGLPVDLYLDGPLDHPFADALRALGAVVRQQAGGDLGQRLYAALADPAAPEGARLLMGTDCVVFQPAWLRAAAGDPADLVVGPAEDGGYWCVGLRAPRPELFQDMPWSTAEVTPTTLQRAEALGLRVSLLPTCYDIDTPADLARLRQDPSCPPSLLPLLGPLPLLGAP